jgi:two-component system OmpR family sensor kinase
MPTKQNNLSLRWRIALLSSLAIALLSIVASITAFLVVRSSLISDLQRSLREDVARVARLYSADGVGGENVTPLEGPTGGVYIQLYNPQGQLIIASNEAFETAILDATVVTSTNLEVRDWQGYLAGRPVQAALAPIDFGYVAVISPTTFIGTALRQLSRSLAVTAFVLVAFSAVIGYLVAAAAMRPISQLATGAAKLDPNYLQPIPYDGPDDEVGQLSRVLNELIVRLRASMDAQRAFLAETSHELRTPLTSLQGFLERAVRRANPEIQHELIDARRIAQTMSRLVADLLQLSRGELVREVVPHLIDPKSEILKPVAEEFQVKLDAEGGTLLLGDPERLRQLMRNLTANAVRATSDPEKVVLRLDHVGGSIVLEVADTGPGIPPEALPHIFNKFYKGAGGGAGLGLAIAKQIAEVHGGEICVRSKPGQGTTFQVKLPVFAEDSE